MKDNESNVTLNAYANCVCRHLLRRNSSACVKLRCVCFTNALKPVENTGDYGENIVFSKTIGRRMRGIVKILLSTVRTFFTFNNCTKNAHRNFLKLQHVENTVLLSLGLALKIRVSVVRFRPRPPYRTVAAAMLLRFSTFWLGSALPPLTGDDAFSTRLIFITVGSTHCTRRQKPYLPAFGSKAGFTQGSKTVPFDRF